MEWISVKERLPEDGQTVIYLITVETAFGLKWKIDYGKWNFKEQIFSGEFFDYRELERGVKYWMLLPEPPKENE